MRLKYYALTLRQMNLKKTFVFFSLIIAISGIFIYFFNEKLEPTLDVICSNNAKNIAFKASNDAVYEYMENVNYNDLINLEKDSSGKVIAITAKVSEINKLSNVVSSNIQSKLEENKESKITLPLSEMLGIRVVAGKGPKINISAIIEGNVDVKFKSEFKEAGVNQTKHTLYVEITTNVSTIAPLFEKENQYINDIMIAETIIVSDIPSSYYEINGIEGLDTKTTLDVIDGK